MPANSKILAVCASLAALLAAGPASAFDVNKSVKVAAGAQSDGASTVNGSVTVGANAIVTGSLETVNGSIRIDDGVQFNDAGTVNGSIRIGDGAIAENDIESVNGTIRIGQNANVSGEVAVVNGKIQIGGGSRIADDVSNVNGEIRIEGTDIGGDLSTVTGDVWLTSNSTLRGDLIIEKPSGWGWGKNRRKPKIVIGPGSRVFGEIDARHEIELYISDSAEVGGVTGESSLDQAIRFSGDRP